MLISGFFIGSNLLGEELRRKTTIPQAQQHGGVETVPERVTLEPVSVREEVEYVAEHAAVRLVDLGVLAPCAGHRREPFALDIEHLREEPARSAELTYLVLGVPALCALEIETLHRSSLLRVRFFDPPSLRTFTGIDSGSTIHYSRTFAFIQGEIPRGSVAQDPQEEKSVMEVS
jgi:hypothetical protein